MKKVIQNINIKTPVSTFLILVLSSLSVLLSMDAVGQANPALAGFFTNVQLANPSASVAVEGNFAYAVGNNALQVIDITNKNAPALRGTIADGGATKLLGPTKVVVSGGYAFVASTSSNALEIIDVSNPLAPAHAGSLFVNQPRSVFVSGNYAYVVGAADALDIVNITNKTAPVLAGTILHNTGGAMLSGATDVFVSGNYAYVVTTTGYLEIVDVSNPSAPSHRGKLAHGTNGAIIMSPFAVAVSGNYAYVTSASSNGLEIINVSNTASPTHAAFYQNGGLLTNASDLVVSGIYAYVTGNQQSTLTILDISNPSSPQLFRSITDVTNLWEIGAFAVSGDYVSVVCKTNRFQLVSFFPPPTSPIANAPTSETQTGLTANWNSVPGATSYRIDVSSNNSFTAMVPGFNNLSVTGTSVAVTGLTAGTTYYIRVRSQNSNGYPSNNSNIITTATVPATPVATAAGGITTTAFTASWSPATGATSYRLDVSADNFASNLGGYDNLSVTGGSYPVSGLTAGTNYQYRVRSASGAGISPNSNVIGVTTVPPAPVQSPATGHTSTSFTANWGAASGAAEYRLDVSTNNSFSSFLSSWNNAVVGGTSQLISGLTAGTTYYYRVRAVNPSGTSVNSGTVTTQTIPANPNALAATGVSKSGFTANWSASAGTSNYLLDVSTNNFASFLPGYDGLSVTTTSQSVTGLNPNTTYQYRVRAVNSAGGTSGNSNVVSTTTLLSEPTAALATSTTTTGFTTNWSSVSGADSYRLDVSTSAGFLSFVSGWNNAIVTGTSWTVTGLASGTTYYYRVRAVNSSSTSANSNSIQVNTVLSQPTANAATGITATSFVANWDAVAGAIDYRLDVSTASDFSSFVSGWNSTTVTGSSRSVTGLTANTTYYYRLRAANTASTSANSNSIQVVTSPQAPVATAATNLTSSGFTANWNAVVGASEYQLDISPVSNFSFFLSGWNSAPVTGTSWPVTGLSPGTTYYYRLRAVNASSSTSANSISITVVTAPLSPIANPATNVTATGFDANWSLISGAHYYQLDVSTVSDFSSFVPGWNASNVSGPLSVTGLNPSTTYYYRVRAFVGSTGSANSNSISVTTLAATLPAPIANAATSVTSNGFTANWQAVTGATGYRIDISTASDFSSFVTGWNSTPASGTSVPVTGLVPSTTYYYRLRAVDATSTSANSGSITVTTSVATLPAPVANPASSVTSSGFTANWQAVTGATGYRIDISTASDFSSFVAGWNSTPVSGTSAPVTGLVPSTTYYYRLRAVDATSTSSNSGSITVTTSVATLPAPVANPASSVTSSGFTANWQAVTGATGYRIDISTASDFSSFVAGWNSTSVSGTSAPVTGLTPSTTYYYRLRAVDATSTSANSNSITVTTSVATLPAPVVNPATSITSNGFTANWQAVAAATGYQLDVSTASDFSSFVLGWNSTPVSGTSAPVTGLVPSTTYYYRLRAVDATSTSANSNSITVTTSVATLPAPVANAASSVTSGGFTANWQAVTGATGYRMDISTASDFSSFVAGWNSTSVSGTSAPVTGLIPSTTYYYRLRAVDATSTSANSNSISVSTLAAALPAPVATAATNVMSSYFTANWNIVTGATSYQVDVSIDNFVNLVASYSSITGTSITVTGRTPNTQHQYRVRAVNASGPSINSNVVEAITIPTTPTAGSPTQVSATSFTAIWNGVAGAVSYQLDVSEDNFTTFVTGWNSTPVTGTSQAISGLSAYKDYSFRVRAVNTYGAVSLNSNAVFVKTLLATPTALAGSSITANGYIANWALVPNATAYRLYTSTDNFSQPMTSYPYYQLSSQSSYSIGFLSAATTYQYRLQAQNGFAFSEFSNIITVMTATHPPVVASPTDATRTTFTATWNAITNAASYRLDLSTDNFATFVTGWNAATVNGTSQFITGLTPGTTYQLRVRAINSSGGPSANSNVVVVTTSANPEPVVSFTSPLTGVYGELVQLTVDAGGSSGAVSYTIATVTGSAQLTGSNLLLTGVGQISITAFVAADANYSAATKTESFSISKAPLTATASDISVPYGNPIPDYDISYSGFVIGDDESMLLNPPVASSSYSPTSNAGTSHVIHLVGGVDDNYELTSLTPGTLTVIPAPLTATAQHQSREYGVSNSPFTIIYSGFKNGEDASALSAEPVALTSATIASGAGIYPIVPSGGSAPNYEIVPVAGNLTITKATLTATADNKTRTYGAPNPVLTVQYAGFRNSDGPGAILQAPVASSTATTISNAGAYPIIVSGGSAPNYQFQYASGTLIISKADQTISFGPLDGKTYGDAPFNVTASSSSGLPLTVSSSNTAVATATGTQLTIHGAGTASIYADQPGDMNHNAAARVVQVLQVAKASQVINFPEIEDRYNTADPFAINAVATSALPVTYKIISGPATVAGNIITPTGIGDVVVSAAQDGNDNYLPAAAVERSFELIDVILGNEDPLFSGLALYPMPIATSAIVEWKPGIREVKVVDLKGVCLLRKSGEDRSSVTLELGNLVPGLFLVEVLTSDNRRAFRKIQIVR